MTRLVSQDYWGSPEFPFFTEAYAFHGGEEILAHSHEFVECAYVKAGEGVHQYGQRSDVLSSGTVFLIAPEREHAYRSASDHPLQIVNVLFEPKVFTPELKVLSQMTSVVDLFYMEPFLRGEVPTCAPLKLNPVERVGVQTELDGMIHELQTRDVGYQVVIKTQLLAFFVQLSRAYERQERRSALSSLPEASLMAAMQSFITTHAMENLTLTQLCQLSAMSASTFTAKFRRYTGQTFVQYRNAARVALAKALLVETDATVAAIAAETGFSDLSFFHHQFRAINGTSPGIYRQQMRSKPSSM
ncbi:MAG: AraC family transcriptional regulator [Firmicutes bacterium]|nr:AraC family transcriptional regulator [Bacillota bacterium]